MKNLLTLFLLFSVVTILSAQNPRIEKFSDYQLVTYTFYKGSGDSVQYKLKDKTDTLQTTLYYRNGKAKSMQWRDSFYFFDVKGRLRTREVGLKKQKNSMSDEERKYDETVEYFPNGQYQTIVMNKNGQYIEQRFDEKGKLIRVKLENHTPSVYRERTTFEHGKTRLSRKVDTLIQNDKSIINFYDTVFYDNGNIYAASLMQKLDNGYIDVLSKKYYNLNGKLVASELPDSVKLKSFKDNIGCYYGLKNRRGDTIWAAQFDHIEFEDKPAFIKAFVGNRCTLLHLDGSPVRMPINNLSDWDVIYNETKENYILIDTYDYVNSDKELDDLLALERNVLFRFTTTDGQFGVMNGEMEMVIPPQYIYPLSSMNRGNWFSFRTNKQNNTVRIGCMDKTGTPIFPDTFKYVAYSGFEDYFILGSEFEESNISMKENYRPILAGLGKGSNQTVVIEPRFDDIELLQQPSLFLVTLKRGNKDNDSDCINGLYDPVAKKWLLEAKDYSIQDSRSESRNVYFVLKNVNTQKYCIMDTNGKYIVKPSMPLDSIGIVDAENGSFWVKKKDKYYFLDIKNGQTFIRPKAYDYLYKIESVIFVNGVKEVSNNFLAKYKGKWGLMEANENSIIPFEYEYVSTNFFDSDYRNGFFMVKNNKASLFDHESIPKESPMTDGNNKNVLRSYVLADNPEALFFINDTGKVVIPPQYREVKGYKNDGYLLVENAEKRQKIVLKETGEVIDKPWHYEMALVHPKSRIMLVKDTADITYGIVRKDGKVLKPCVNYGVALGDIEASTFFVKRDTPLIQRPQMIDFYKNGYDLIRFKKDSLNIEDNDWFLHDVEGQLLNKQPFRYPFDFYKGIGIGVQGEDFNLYKTDGTILPPQYKNSKTGVPTGFNNIIRIEPYNHYALFRNQGLVPTMIVTDSEGHALVESGRYDGISRFYDKYALVSAEGKIGLIDTSGREIITPQDLRASKIALIDSINRDKSFLHNNLEREDNEFFNEFPVVINTEQFELTTKSLKINEQQRTDLLNLMLDISLPDMLTHAQDMRIERNSLVAKAQFVETYANASFPYLSLNKLSITDKFISFIYQGFRLEFGQSYNFQKVNNRWEKRTLYDIIDLRGTKQAHFNSLMTQKIRAMKDITINCSEGTDFLKQVENRFILTEKGIDFCFESADWRSQLVVVSFTWEELKLL